MKTSTMMTSAMPSAPVGKAWEEVSASFDRFCLAAGVQTLGAIMEADAEVACGPRHSRSEDRRDHRWGRTAGKIGFHAGKVAIERPRVRGLDGKELPLKDSRNPCRVQKCSLPPSRCGCGRQPSSAASSLLRRH
jgi:putative transposase